MSIAVELTSHKGIPVLELRGVMNDIDVDTFIERLDELIAAGHPKVIIDISRITFIGSFGLGKIVSCNARLRKEKRELVLLNTNPDPEAFIASLLRLTNLYKVLRIVTDSKDI